MKQNGAALAFLGSEIWVTFWMYLEIKKINISLLNQNIWLKLICIIACLSVFIFAAKYIGINVILNGIMYVFIYGFLLVGLKLVDIKNKTVVT